jgi:hypothetical protein
MTKASADADKFGATGTRVHKEPGMLAWLWWQVEAALSYVSHSQQSPRSIMAIQQWPDINIRRR